MVVFVCNNCNDSLKKQQVEVHLTWNRCRGCSVSCLDCHRDFDKQSVKHHTQCITEEEKYSGGNFKPKVSTINGERKRNEWMELVQRVAAQKDPRRSSQVQQLLNICARMQTVPTKKNAFENFVANGQKNYIHCAAAAWQALEKEKDATMAKNNPNKPVEKQDQSAKIMKVDASPVKSEKKKKSKENGEESENLKSQGDSEEGKNKKKRKLLEDSKPDVEGTEVDSNKKKKKKSLVTIEFEDESTSDVESKKKKKKSIASGEEGIPEVGEISVESKKKKKKSMVNSEITEEGKLEVEEISAESKKKKKKSVSSAKEVVEISVESKKKKKKSVSSSEITEESKLEVEEISVESKKKKKKSMVSAEEVAEISVESKKKKKKSMSSSELTEELSTPEVEETAVESKKKKKKSMVNAEPDDEEIAADSTKNKKNMTSDGIEQEEVKQPLSRKQLKKQKKQERFEQQLAIIEKDTGNVEFEDKAVEKKDKKGKKKNGMVNGNHEVKLQNGNSEDHEVGEQSKKSKKRKADAVNGEDFDAEKKSRLNETLEETEAAVLNGGKFQWKSTIEDILRSAKHNRLPLKKMRRKVLHAYADQGGDPRDKNQSQEYLETKFSKMLAKMPNVKVENEQLQLLLNIPPSD